MLRYRLVEQTNRGLILVRATQVETLNSRTQYQRIVIVSNEY